MVSYLATEREIKPSNKQAVETSHAWLEKRRAKALELIMGDHDALQRPLSILAQKPARVLGRSSQILKWQTAPEKIFEHNESGDRWYVGGVMNTCFNCVDRHVEAGHGARIAFIHDSPMTGTKSQISYAELLDRVQCVATMMQDKGIEKGDRVIIYMPMIVETAIAAFKMRAARSHSFNCIWWICRG